MAAFRISNITLIAIVGLSTAFTSCTSPFAASAVDSEAESGSAVLQTGSVRVGVGDQSDVNASFGASSLSAAAVDYSGVVSFVVGLENDDSTIPPVTPAVITLNPDQSYPSVTFEGVTEGVWTVTATGRDSTGGVIMEGSRRGIVVEADSTIEVSLVLFRLGTPEVLTPPPVEPEPTFWELQEAEGYVRLEEDGSVIFLPASYICESGAQYITVDETDGSILHEAAGERRSFISMGDTASARIAFTGVQVTNNGGWGVFFHGTHSLTGAYGEFNGYTLQFDMGLNDRIVIRQWVDGRSLGVELTPFQNVAAADFGIDLVAPMDIVLILEAGSLILDVTQSGQTVRVFDIPDLPSLANEPDNARTSGFLGIRTWNDARLTIDRMAVTFLE